MALLRMLAFRPQQHAGQMSTMVAQSQTQPQVLESPSATEPVSTFEPESVPEPESQEVSEPEVIVAPPADLPPWEDEPVQEQQQAPGLVPVDVPVPMPMPVEQQVPTPVVQQTKAPVPVVEEASVIAAGSIVEKPKNDWTLADLSENNWTQVFNDLNVSGMTHGIAANMVFTQRQGTHLQFTLEQGQSSMLNETHQGRIRQALEEMFGCELKLTIDIGQTQIETPFANRQRRETQHQDYAIASLQDDPNVASLTTAFNGQLDTGSILPVNPIET